MRGVEFSGEVQGEHEGSEEFLNFGAEAGFEAEDAVVRERVSAIEVVGFIAVF